jgi:hypothetical protein
MKKLIFFLCILAPALAISQASPGFASLTAGPDFYSIRTDSYANETYAVKTTFSAGVQAASYLGKRTAIRFGLFYAALRYDVDFNYSTFQPNDPLIPEFSEIKASYFNVPLTCSFDFISREKIKVCALGGLVTYTKISSSEKTTYADGSQREESFLDSFTWGATIGAGARYNFTDRLGIIVEPQYRLFFKGFAEGMQPPTAASITAGLVLTLRQKSGE